MDGYVVGLGEILFDMLPEGKKLGGAPANFAYHAWQMGFNGLAVSAIGKDDLGDEVLSILDGVRLPYDLPRLDSPTGTVKVTLDEAGVPSYEIIQGTAWDEIPFTDELEKIARETKCVCFGSLAQRSPVSRATINRFLDTMPEGSLKVFDINLRQSFYSFEVISESLKKADILKINDDEIKIVSHLLGFEEKGYMPVCQRLLRDWNLEFVILTCGTEGSYVVGKDSCSFLETPKVEVADTVGAGDSFTAAFCACWMKGMPVEKAHRRAVDVSAYVCTKSGAMPVLPKEFVD